MVIPGLLVAFFKLLGRIAAGLLFFVMNMVLLWNFSGIRHKEKIENGSTTWPFQVIVIESGKAQLFLFKEDLDDYLRTHSNYSFLIPTGQDQLVQDQIVASYDAKFGIHGGKGYPTFKRQVLDANRQYIEVYMHGDPHDDVFWYEASDKAIEPKYYMVFGVFHLLFMAALAIGLTVVECSVAVMVFRKKKARLVLSGA